MANMMKALIKYYQQEADKWNRIADERETLSGGIGRRGRLAEDERATLRGFRTGGELPEITSEYKEMLGTQSDVGREEQRLLAHERLSRPFEEEKEEDEKMKRLREALLKFKEEGFAPTATIKMDGGTITIKPEGIKEKSPIDKYLALQEPIGEVEGKIPYAGGGFVGTGEMVPGPSKAELLRKRGISLRGISPSGTSWAPTELPREEEFEPEGYKETRERIAGVMALLEEAKIGWQVGKTAKEKELERELERLMELYKRQYKISLRNI